jgi:hypothetical protein
VQKQPFQRHYSKEERKTQYGSCNHKGKKQAVSNWLLALMIAYPSLPSPTLVEPAKRSPVMLPMTMMPAEIRMPEKRLDKASRERLLTPRGTLWGKPPSAFWFQFVQ